MVSLSQVSVKHNAAEFEKSLFVLVRRSSSSVLLGRDRWFARWMLGSAVRKLRSRSLTSTPARFPLFRLSARLTRTAAPPTKTSNKVSEYSKTGKKNCPVCCLMSSSSSLVKLIKNRLTKHRTNKQTKTLKERERSTPQQPYTAPSWTEIYFQLINYTLTCLFYFYQSLCSCFPKLKWSLKTLVWNILGTDRQIEKCQTDRQTDR